MGFFDKINFKMLFILLILWQNILLGYDFICVFKIAVIFIAELTNEALSFGDIIVICVISVFIAAGTAPSTYFSIFESKV